MKHKVQTNQLGQSCAGWWLLGFVGVVVLAAAVRKHGPFPFIVAMTAGVWIAGWRLLNRKEGDMVKLKPAHVVQLEYWCGRLGISTPEIIRYRKTDTGERYDLRVTGDDDDGKVMTPEKFRTFWQQFRAIAGDGCRGVFISPPDKEHGGRCSMTVVWRGEVPKPASRYPYEVQTGPSTVHMCYDDNELYFALAEAAANGIKQELPAWAAPNPAERVGEG